LFAVQGFALERLFSWGKYGFIQSSVGLFGRGVDGGIFGGDAGAGERLATHCAGAARNAAAGA
jgi:hypothetical protein